MSTEIAVEKLAEDPRIRRIVWKNLGIKTVREIAEDTGLDPAAVLRIKQEMLDEIDVLTVQQMRAKLIADLQDMARKAQDDYENAPMEFKSGLMNSSLSAIKAILIEQGRSSKEDDAVIRLNELRMKELVSLVQETVDVSVRRISEIYNIPEDALFEIFNTNLQLAAQRRDNETP